MEEFADGAFDIGMEAADDSTPVVAAVPAAESSSEPAAEPPRLDLADDVVRHELFALLDMAFVPEEPTAPAGAVPRVATSPLFSDFSPTELVAVMRDLKLHEFEPGEILVTQGEPGESLFILASGRARAYVKDAKGRSTQAREMNEGDFFGEIAVMTGLPRTATVTASTRCELLELDRAALDRLTKAQPRIREVLQAFYSKHMGSSSS